MGLSYNCFRELQTVITDFSRTALQLLQDYSRTTLGNHCFLLTTILRLENKITVPTTLILGYFDFSHLCMAFGAKNGKFWVENNFNRVCLKWLMRLRD